ncbi:unnamed protein product [Caretta caretta]
MFLYQDEAVFLDIPDSALEVLNREQDGSQNQQTAFPEMTEDDLSSVISQEETLKGTKKFRSESATVGSKGVTGNYSFANKRTPKGWNVFMKALAELNVPMSVAGHVTNKEFLERLKTRVEPVKAISSSTPSKKRKISWLTV